MAAVIARMRTKKKKTGSDGDPSSPTSSPTSSGSSNIYEKFEEKKEDFIKWFNEKENAQGVNNFVKEFNECLQQCKNLKPTFFDSGEKKDKIQKRANYCSTLENLTLDGFDDLKYNRLKRELSKYDEIQYEEFYKDRKNTIIDLIYGIEYIRKIEEKNEKKLRKIEGLYRLVTITKIETIKRFFNYPLIDEELSTVKQQSNSGGKRRTRRRTRRRNKKTTKRKANKKTKMKRRKTHKRKTNKRRRR